MTSTTLPPEILERLAHLASIGEEPHVPELLPTRDGLVDQDAVYCFMSPTMMYPVEGARDRYLIAMYGADCVWTLVAVDNLAHEDHCEDPGCVEVRERLGAQYARIPAGTDGGLFTTVYVDPGVNWLPRRVPYLVHVDDAAAFSGDLLAGLEVTVPWTWS